MPKLPKTVILLPFLIISIFGPTTSLVAQDDQNPTEALVSKIQELKEGNHSLGEDEMTKILGESDAIKIRVDVHSAAKHSSSTARIIFSQDSVPVTSDQQAMSRALEIIRKLKEKEYEVYPILVTKPSTDKNPWVKKFKSDLAEIEPEHFFHERIPETPGGKTPDQWRSSFILGGIEATVTAVAWYISTEDIFLTILGGSVMFSMTHFFTLFRKEVSAYARGEFGWMRKMPVLRTYFNDDWIYANLRGVAVPFLVSNIQKFIKYALITIVCGVPFIYMYIHANHLGDPNVYSAAFSEFKSRLFSLEGLRSLIITSLSYNVATLHSNFVADQERRQALTRYQSDVFQLTLDRILGFLLAIEHLKIETANLLFHWVLPITGALTVMISLPDLKYFFIPGEVRRDFIGQRVFRPRKALVEGELVVPHKGPPFLRWIFGNPPADLMTREVRIHYRLGSLTPGNHRINKKGKLILKSNAGIEFVPDTLRLSDDHTYFRLGYKVITTDKGEETVLITKEEGRILFDEFYKDPKKRFVDLEIIRGEGFFTHHIFDVLRKRMKCGGQSS